MVTGKTNKGDTIFACECYIQRKWKAYFWNNYFVELIITLFTFLIFTTEPDGYTERRDFLIGLLFAQIASLYVVKSGLPKTDILTHLDMYTLFGLIFTLFVGIESVIVSFIKDDDQIKNILIHLIVKMNTKNGWKPMKKYSQPQNC